MSKPASSGCPYCGQRVTLGPSAQRFMFCGRCKQWFQCVDGEPQSWSVEIEHFGGVRRSFVPTINLHYGEVHGTWKDVTGYAHTPVTFSLKTGLIVAMPEKRNWRLTQRSFDECCEAAGIARPGSHHRWDVPPKRSPRKTRTPKDPRQLELKRCR